MNCTNHRLQFRQSLAEPTHWVKYLRPVSKSCRSCSLRKLALRMRRSHHPLKSLKFIIHISHPLNWQYLCAVKAGDGYSELTELGWRSCRFTFVSSTAIWAPALALFSTKARFDSKDFPPDIWLILSSTNGVTCLPLIPSSEHCFKAAWMAPSIFSPSAEADSGIGTAIKIPELVASSIFALISLGINKVDHF